MRYLSKAIIAAILICACANSARAECPVVSPDSTISFPFYLADSLGSGVARASGDTLWIYVYYPSGGLAFRDSVRVLNDGNVTYNEYKHGSKVSASMSYKRTVSAIDGTAQNGPYAVHIQVWDSSLVLESNFTYCFDERLGGLDSIGIDGTQLATTTGAIQDATVGDGTIDWGGELDTTGSAGSTWSNGTRTLTSGSGLTIAAVSGLADTMRDVIGDTLNATAGNVYVAIVNGLGDTIRDVVGDTFNVVGGKVPVTFVDGLGDTLRDVVGDTFNVISGGVLLAARGSDADTGIAGIKTKLTTVVSLFNEDSAITQNRLDSLYKLTEAVAAQDGINPTARRYFVAKNGNDVNNGLSWETPWLSLQRALFEVNKDSATAYPTPQYVYFGAMECTTAVACTVRADNVHLIGSGNGRTVIRRLRFTSNGDPVFKMGSTATERADHCELANLDIAGYDTTASALNRIIRGNFADSVEVHHCNLLHGYVGILLDANQCDGWHIHHNTVRWMNIDGIIMNSDFSWVHNNSIQGDSTENAFDAIATSGDFNFICDNSVAAENGGVATGGGAWKNVVIGNRAATHETGTIQAYQHTANDSTRFAGNFGPSRLIDALGGHQDSAASIQDELFALYNKQNLDSLAGDISPGQVAQAAADKIGFAAMNMGDDSGAWISGADTSAMMHLRLIDSKVSAAGGGGKCNGTGIVSCTLDVRNASGGLGNVTVEIHNTSNVFLWSQVSNSNGFTYFNLDTMTTYRVKAGGLPGSIHDSLPWQTLVTTSANHIRDTVPMTTNAIPAPPAANLKRIYDYIYRFTGDSIQGADVIVELLTPDSTKVPYDSVTGVSLGKNPVIYATHTDVTGRYIIDMIPNDHIIPHGSRYQVTVYSERRRVYSVQINAIGTTQAQTRTLQ